MLRKLGRTEGPVCVFDVGANSGQFAQLVVRTVPDARLRLHCFEPSPTAFAALSENMGGDPRVKLHRLALGSEPGQATLHTPNPGSSLASLTQRDATHCGIAFECREDVSIDTLDEVCDRHKIDRIQLLKLDVEGHELAVLRGGSRMLASERVEMVTFEFGGCNIDTRTYFRDYYKFLSDLGMRIFRITPSGYLHPITRYDEDLEQFRSSNFVARR